MESRTEFHRASLGDAGRIACLVNSAYRGQRSKIGWTTEADLLGGQRTDASEVSGLIEAEGSFFLLCEEGGELVGSVHVEQSGEAAKLGMLAVRPERQGRGIGKRLLAEAETAALFAWKIRSTKMAVLALRTELIEFYERRGYRRTGCFAPFPEDPKFGIPKVEGLHFEWLEKVFSPPIFERS